MSSNLRTFPLSQGLPAALVLALLLAVMPARAGIDSEWWGSVVDRPYGEPFNGLGWRGNTKVLVPDSCLPTGTAVVDNLVDCGGEAVLTQARVELYDTTQSGQPTLATLIFDPASMLLLSLGFIDGALTQLSTDRSDFVGATADLSAFGVAAGTEFALLFSFENGPRLYWQQCVLDQDCTSGANDAAQFKSRVEFIRVPEPGALALSMLALGLAGWARRRNRGGACRL